MTCAGTATLCIVTEPAPEIAMRKSFKSVSFPSLICGFYLRLRFGSTFGGLMEPLKSSFVLSFAFTLRCRFLGQELRESRVALRLTARVHFTQFLPQKSTPLSTLYRSFGVSDSLLMRHTGSSMGNIFGTERNPRYKRFRALNDFPQTHRHTYIYTTSRYNRFRAVSDIYCTKRYLL